ncbi:hypothetical protein GCM10027521_27650 [Amycolatopsis cihanbeyliensis]
MCRSACTISAPAGSAATGPAAPIAIAKAAPAIPVARSSPRLEVFLSTLISFLSDRAGQNWMPKLSMFPVS